MLDTKVIIIGGGPAGLSAALYLARAGLKPLVFAGSPPGGQLMLTSEVENFPGFESILGAELIEKMRAQVKKFGAEIIDQNISKAIINNSKKQVVAEEKIYTTKGLVIATGAKALWLNVPGEQELRGKGVSACATCDGFFFRDKVVAVVGGGDTAMEEALTLTKFAKKVYLIHRRDSFRASKIMQERVMNNAKIEIFWNTVVREVIGKDKVEGVRLKINQLNFRTSELASRLKSGSLAPRSSSESEVSPRRSLAQTSTDSENSSLINLAIDGLFVAIGHKPDTDIFKDQISLDEKGYIITAERAAWELAKKLKTQNSNVKTDIEDFINQFNFKYKTVTSIEGVFAAGDCVDYQYQQAGIASGMGITAALEVEKWMEESSKY